MIKRHLIRYEVIVAIGFLITILSMAKVVGWLELSSDVFWAIAGIGVMVEACVELYYEGKEGSEE